MSRVWLYRRIGRLALQEIEAEAEALERVQIDRYREALRWIALGRTGSYGTPQAFAAAVLENEDA